jgi:hypothetical protein
MCMSRSSCGFCAKSSNRGAQQGAWKGNVRSCGAAPVRAQLAAGCSSLEAYHQASLTESTFFQRLGKPAMGVLNAPPTGQRTLHRPAAGSARVRSPGVRSDASAWRCAPTYVSMYGLSSAVLLMYGPRSRALERAVVLARTVYSSSDSSGFLNSGLWPHRKCAV